MPDFDAEGAARRGDGDTRGCLEGGETTCVDALGDAGDVADVAAGDARGGSAKGGASGAERSAPPPPPELAGGAAPARE